MSKSMNDQTCSNLMMSQYYATPLSSLGLTRLVIEFIVGKTLKTKIQVAILLLFHFLFQRSKSPVISSRKHVSRSVRRLLQMLSICYLRC